MNRYRLYGQRDDNPEVVGDAGFTKLDMLTDAAMLQPGVVPLSENMRFDTNGSKTRAGLARQFGVGTAIGAILNARVYKPSGDDDNLALVTANALVLFRTANQTVKVYPFPNGETADLSANLDSVQGGVASGTIPQYRILRGLNKTVLLFDGTTVTVDGHTPPSELALYYQDRIVVNNTAQSVSVSDFDDFTHFSVLNQFQILTGGDDFLTAFLPYQKDYVLIGMRKSWFVAFFDPQLAAGGATSTGYSGALAGDTSFLRELTREAGPVGPKAVKEALGKIWFITDGAIYAFVPQIDNELTVLGKPISADIQPIMDRMAAASSRGAWIERAGYRLYFGMPINDEPVPISSITVTSQAGYGLTLPFNIPALLGPGAISTVVTTKPHGLAVNDTNFVSGASTAALNGKFPVISVLDAWTYIYSPLAQPGAVLGANATSQKVAARNNRIAVYNLNNDGWESVDTLPPGVFADYGLSADYGTKRRLWIVDKNYGPFLYEENENDDIGTVVGGVTLPFTLPVTLTTANYATSPVPGHWTSRAFRWGYQGTLGGGYSGNMSSAAAPRKVRQCEVRATLDPASLVKLTLLARTPNNTLWTGTRTFTAAQFATADAPLRKLCGTRALEAQIDVVTGGGRPSFRAVEVETAAVGRVEE